MNRWLKKYRQEPKNLQHFFDIYRNNPYKLGIGPLQSHLCHDAAQEQTEVLRVVHSLMNLVNPPGEKKPSQGKGFQLFFPLTSGLRNGEFVSGVLSVLAREALVTFLLTPRSFSKARTLKDGRVVRRRYSPKDEDLVLSNPKKTLHPETEHVRVVDFSETGQTLKAITKGLAKLNFSGTLFPDVVEGSPSVLKTEIADHIGSFLSNVPGGVDSGSLGLRKLPSEKAAMPLPDLWRYTRSREARDTPPEKMQGMHAEHYFLRRFYYNLGVATAKTYLEIMKKRQAESQAPNP